MTSVCCDLGKNILEYYYCPIITLFSKNDRIKYRVNILCHINTTFENHYKLYNNPTGFTFSLNNNLQNYKLKQFSNRKYSLIQIWWLNIIVIKYRRF